jgi:hypothetical protein
MNTTLFDCQLTSCDLAQETLLTIAELLFRNRKAKGADMQAGPYQAPRPADLSYGSRGAAGTFEEVVALLGPDNLRCGNEAGAETVAVTFARTAELLSTLADWRVSRRERGLSADTAMIQELMDLLDKGQRATDENRQATDEMKEHTRLLMEGYKDREQRYRKDIQVAQDKLVDHQREMIELRAVHRRYADELALHRDHAEQMQSEFSSLKDQFEGEEVRLQNELLNIGEEQKELKEHHKNLVDKMQLWEAECSKLRSKMGLARDYCALESERISSTLTTPRTSPARTPAPK